MPMPSFSVICSIVFICFIFHSIYSISLLFSSPPCRDDEPCLSSFLSGRPKMDLHLFMSIMAKPTYQRDTEHVHSLTPFDYQQTQEIPVIIDVPRKTSQNGTLYLHLIITPESNKYRRVFNDILQDERAIHLRVKMSRYKIPQAETFNLLGTKKAKGERVTTKPITHLQSKVYFTMMTDDVRLPVHNIPMEIVRQLKVIPHRSFLPIVNNDFLHTRQTDFVRVINKTLDVTVLYSPISLGKLRFILQMETAMRNLRDLGFSDKDIDEVKGIFADTNLYLLCSTIVIASMHLLFDFLSFKNDISFWRNKNNLTGLSVRTILWRAFSGFVVFMYLFDEKSSLLVSIPAGIAVLIELWKVKKVFRAEFARGTGFLPRIKFNTSKSSADEAKTREFDAEGMKYMSYILYPLLLGGAIYSLLYYPHKSWYSWTVNSLVKGVYAFDFLFMLPQLFVNYKLKSVAHLPWRTFMYKAFNTVIDDVFAFIITMPTAHRVACFRDDVVFLIYLYQRWLYPVDKTRIDSATIQAEIIDTSSKKKQ